MVKDVWKELWSRIRRHVLTASDPYRLPVSESFHQVIASRSPSNLADLLPTAILPSDLRGELNRIEKPQATNRRRSASNAGEGRNNRQQVDGAPEREPLLERTPVMGKRDRNAARRASISSQSEMIVPSTRLLRSSTTMSNGSRRQREATCANQSISSSNRAGSVFENIPEDDASEESQQQSPKRRRLTASNSNKKKKALKNSPRPKKHQPRKGVSFAPHTKLWSVSWSLNGKRFRENFRIRDWGAEKAWHLATITREEAESTSKFPTMEAVVALYASGRRGIEVPDQELVSSRCSSASFSSASWMDSDVEGSTGMNRVGSYSCKRGTHQKDIKEGQADASCGGDDDDTIMDFDRTSIDSADDNISTHDNEKGTTVSRHPLPNEFPQGESTTNNKELNATSLDSHSMAQLTHHGGDDGASSSQEAVSSTANAEHVPGVRYNPVLAKWIVTWHFRWRRHSRKFDPKLLGHKESRDAAVEWKKTIEALKKKFTQNGDTVNDEEWNMLANYNSDVEIMSDKEENTDETKMEAAASTGSDPKSTCPQSGIRGVSYDKSSRRWRASLGSKNGKLHLGSFRVDDYGYDKAKALAILSRNNAEKFNDLGGLAEFRSFITALYESQNATETPENSTIAEPGEECEFDGNRFETTPLEEGQHLALQEQIALLQEFGLLGGAFQQEGEQEVVCEDLGDGDDPLAGEEMVEINNHQVTSNEDARSIEAEQQSEVGEFHGVSQSTPQQTMEEELNELNGNVNDDNYEDVEMFGSDDWLKPQDCASNSERNFIIERDDSSTGIVDEGFSAGVVEFCLDGVPATVVEQGSASADIAQESCEATTEKSLLEVNHSNNLSDQYSLVDRSSSLHESIRALSATLLSDSLNTHSECTLDNNN